MKAFVFASNNEFKGKFNLPSEKKLPQAFQEYSSRNAISPFDYIEWSGKKWTVVSKDNGYALAQENGDLITIIQSKQGEIENETQREIPISTTPSIPNSTIKQSHGVVFGEAIMGANILRDFAGALTDVFGGRSGAYESKLKQGRSIALQELMDEACDIGANAIVGVSIGYETIGNTNSMLMICASGTAVTVENSHQSPGSRHPHSETYFHARMPNE